jgi:hypothetical protein|tara:strand:- start:236 stop:481 length:246 start_codon:yes stop_codon:yes gene_type:complete
MDQATNNILQQMDGTEHVLFGNDTGLINNAVAKSGVGINRWEPLFFNPQKNTIEPFARIGENTVLKGLDAYSENCDQIKKM